MSKAKILKHIVSAQKQQIKIKEKNQRYVPGTLNLQILGSGAPGAPASVYLFTDQSRYLFNCGEGTQRLAHEHKTKLTRLEHIFITQTSWNRIGGLPGLTLTIQDAGVPNITLHGPPKLHEALNAMRHFVILKQLSVEAPHCEENTYYDDSVLRVDYVPIRKPKANDEAKDEIVMAFICRCKPRPGALSLQKCLDLGVPKGPLLGKLKNGEIVVLDNGTEVRPEDVCEPDDPGPIFIVIDIPSTDYLDGLLENEKFNAFRSETLAEIDKADLVLHFSPASIVQTDVYQEFLLGFPKSTKHLVLNDSNKFSGYVAAHRLQWQLNQLNQHIFPILKESTDCLHQKECESNGHKRRRLSKDDSVKVSGSVHIDGLHLEHAAPMTCFHMRPKKGIDQSLVATVNPDEYIKEIQQLDGVQESLEALKRLNLQTDSLDRSPQYPKIVFLGTGSCIPNKTRNVSSILVHTSKDACILLDAGEGTCGQIVRFYGSAANDVLRKIKAVYISHLHADHHIGLFGVLQMRKRLLGEQSTPVTLLAPVQIESWLHFYDIEIEQISSEFALVSNRDLMNEGLPHELTEPLGLSSFRTCLVPHCANAFGVTFTIADSEHDPEKAFKITYSGDTMPCDSLVELGNESTVLIHEATMEDDLGDDALAKMHSTVSQAIEQGVRMNAKHILLTHFSQRYAKIPRIEEGLVGNVGIAFDNMEVVPSDFNRLTQLYPVLKKMFPEHWDEMEQKSLKRANRKAIAFVEEEVA